MHSSLSFSPVLLLAGPISDTCLRAMRGEGGESVPTVISLTNHEKGFVLQSKEKEALYTLALQ